MPRYLGQHFLKDQKKVSRIVSAIQKMIDEYKKTYPDMSLIEVGPGQGALTKGIFDISPNFLCIEKDLKMQPHLLAFLEPENIMRADVLEAEIDFSDTPHLVVGNLPYYITSPIFRKFFVDQTDALGGVFLIQKEVADKIKTDAPKKSYLWWLVNNYYTINYLFIVKPKAFRPPPKVDSAVISFTRKEQPELEDMSGLVSFLDHVSYMKRKTLGAIQKKASKKGVTLTIPEDLRGKRLEEITRPEMKRMIDHT